MKSVMITGAGSGIGQALATTFSNQGDFVILVGRNLEKLKKTQELCPQDSLILSGDITSPHFIERIDQALSDLKFPLSTLINNAGTFIRKPFLSTSKEDWLKQYNIHVEAPMRLIQISVPHMRKSLALHELTVGEPNIINISSSLSTKPTAEISAYCAMKAAQNSLTQCLALELAPDIRINAVLPGIVDTPIHDFHNSQDKDLIKKKLAPLQPMNRVGEPQDITSLCQFLAAPANSWITGSLITIDGGINLK